MSKAFINKILMFSKTTSILWSRTCFTFYYVRNISIQFNLNALVKLLIPTLEYGK